VTLTMEVRANTPQTVKLAVQNLPQGWNVTFRGGGAIVDEAYLDGVNPTEVDLRIDTPADVKAGSYSMVAAATGPTTSAQIPLNFTVQAKLPPSLTMTVDGLPTQQGTPSTTFQFNINLKNDGGEDLVVVLSLDPLQNFQVSYQYLSQAVTQIQVAAGETKNLTVQAVPLITIPAGDYQIGAHARAGAVQADLALTATVLGQGDLTVSSPDGRLSGTAQAGQSTPLKVELTNVGTAPLLGVTLTSTPPTGWDVTFDQPKIAQIGAGQKVDVTATIKPANNAVAGDYMVTVSAQPLDSKTASSDFRITVTTSTLWGVVGIVLIAIAVAAVGLAVARFGRR
jgi:uncharacterized membrane protein